MDHFIAKAGKSLRLGRTTGSCAALAAQAAARMLLTGKEETAASLVTPKGIRIEAELLDIVVTASEAGCSVRKDAGDDPDVTDGVLVSATVRRAPGDAVIVDGGAGVGRVTKPGLDQPVGAAAINSVPRQMIEREVRAVCDELGYDGGMSVVIGVPGGAALAARTFNPNLGIVGGISIIGTTGIVEPMSTQAIIDTMRVEMNMLRAEGATGLILTPGNYGETFLRAMPAIARRPVVKCSNFVGEGLDMAAAAGFAEALLVGHVGKFVKLSGGVMDTHSRIADCRMELLALHAALAGAEPALLRRVLDAVTVDEGIDMLGDLRDAVLGSLLRRAETYARRRAGATLDTGVAVFSNRSGLVGVSDNARVLLARWEETGG